MSFQAYLDSTRAKTDKGPDAFKEIAREKGFHEPGVKAGTIVAWLKEDFKLGHGHAMAIYGTLKSDGRPRPTTTDKVAQDLSGGRAAARNQEVRDRPGHRKPIRCRQSTIPTLSTNSDQGRRRTQRGQPAPGLMPRPEPSATACRGRARRVRITSQ